MTRGHRSASNCNTTTSPSSTAAASSSTSSSNNFQQQQTPRRGNKTLGWYLGDKLTTSSANDADSSGRESPFTNNSQMAPQSRPRRRGSLIETVTTTPISSRPAGKLTTDEQNSAKMGKRQMLQHHQHQPKQSIANSNGHRPRANSSATNAKKTLAQSNSQSGTAASNLANDSAKQTDAATANQNAQQRIGKGPNTKEDYWYYDEVSDGFYYEHNGTRGWRKRRPEWGTVEQMKGITGTEQSAKGVTEQQQQQLVQKQKALEGRTSSGAMPSLLAPPQQLSKFAVQQLPHDHLLSPTPTNFKYNYDPTSDGFYYEMASFDGWKRRQPHSGVSTTDGTSPPHATLSSLYCSPSLGANNGNEQHSIISTTTAQQHWQCATPGLNGQNQQQAPHRKVQPLHYQAYQQPAPQINPVELQEMIMLAQQSQHHLRAATTAAAAPPPSSCCCSQLSCYPNSTGNPTAACCCTNIAAMAAQMVLKQQKLAEQVQCHQQNNSDNNMANGLPTEPNKSLSMDNIRSLLDTGTTDKPSLLDNYGVDTLHQQKGTRPTVYRLNHQHQNEHSSSNNSEINSLKLPRNKWDHHQLGGIVPSPPLLIQSQQTMGRRSSSSLINTTTVAANNCNTTASKTNTALSTGSFEEPYEFYWSGDETGSEVVPLGGVVNTKKQQQNEQKIVMDAKKEKEQSAMATPPFPMSAATTTAASVSSIEEDEGDGCGMLDKYMAEMLEKTALSGEKQRKIAPIGSEANHFGSANKKRPNTLKLACPRAMPIVRNGNDTNGLSVSVAAYEPISPGEILRDDELEHNNNDTNNYNNDNISRKECVADSPPVSYLPYQFNVDKFIADVLLPPSSQQLHSSVYTSSSSTTTNSLFTPLAQHPLTSDSPLFTPVMPSTVNNGITDPWYYGKGSENIATAYRPLKQHVENSNPWAYP